LGFLAIALKWKRIEFNLELTTVNGWMCYNDLRRSGQQVT
jgi:hypothetical protein